MKNLLGLGLSLALGSGILSGCSGEQKAASGTAPTASNAPENSSADEAASKTGGDHHASESDAQKAHAHSTKLDFSSVPNALPVGKTATWTLKISDVQSGAPVNDFTVVHDKLMHLIVVKKDLSWFNHLHPNFKGDGTFTLSAALPSAGVYKIYADYTPKGKTQEVPSQEILVSGDSTVTTRLIPDKMQGMWMTKKVAAHPEGEPDKKGGAMYEVALMPMPVPPVAGEEAMLHFQVRDAKGKPLTDLQPYLGALGHCVVLSSDSESYLHSHPMADGAKHDMSKMGKGETMQHSTPKSGGPDVMFHTTFPTAGLYKAWGQFKHKGQIITAAFVVNVAAAKKGATSATSQAQPHSH
ncbi:MAG TPA: hypothetical protein VF681_14325 [Abditibacteriaceae bacterium]